MLISGACLIGTISAKYNAVNVLGAIGVFGILCSSLALGCNQEPNALDPDELGSAQQMGIIEGRWRIPPNVAAIGDLQDVDYTGAGDWLGEASCSGNFTSGGEILQEYIYENFPQTNLIGGYSCRPIVGNSSKASVHSTGRALDIMIPTIGGDADNDLGDPIAHWLIENAEEIGIQFIIWDQSSWGANRTPGEKERPYSGGSPHLDHLHVELSLAGGDASTPWFGGTREPPVLPNCPTLPTEGGIIDDTAGCTQLRGPAQYWRIDEEAGFAGRLAWTNAQQDETPSNWASWRIPLASRGEYELEIYTDNSFAKHTEAKYELSHAGEVSEFIVDQTSTQGWVKVGKFNFAAEGLEELSLYDTSDGPVEEEQHVAVDAIRLTRVGQTTIPEDDDEEGGGFRSTGFLGCQTSPLGTGLSLLWALVFLAALRRRSSKA